MIHSKNINVHRVSKYDLVAVSNIDKLLFIRFAYAYLLDIRTRNGKYR